MIKKIILFIMMLIGAVMTFLGGAMNQYSRDAEDRYVGAQKLISDCELELKRTQKCVLIAVEDEPESAANDNNN